VTAGSPCSLRRRALGEPGLDARHDTRTGIDDHLALLRIQQREGAIAELVEAVAETDHERRAAGAGEQGDVAGGAAVREHGAAKPPPVGRQKARRREVFGREDRRGVDAGRGAAPGARSESVQHAVAQILEVGGARREHIVVTVAISRDFGVEHHAPRSVRRFAVHDGPEDGTDQILVIEECHLKLEDLGAGPAGRFGQRLEVGSAAGERPLERGSLLGCRAWNALGDRATPLEHQRGEGETARCHLPQQPPLRRALTHRSSARPGRPGRAPPRPRPALRPRTPASGRGGP
jgi:hypothetical protein